MRKFTILLAIGGAFLAGCAVNPVTGKRQLMTVSTASEIQMGQQNYAPMRQSQGGDYDIDPALTQYVQGVGGRLAAQSEVALPYEFVVLNNSVPNAWALPGGKIAINRGLLTELESEAELAAVLGHEVVHAAARHTASQISRGMLLQGLVLTTAVASSDSDYGNLAVGGAGLAAQLITMKYGREAELESDYYGMQYMSKAGYDPRGAVSLQETFVRLSEGRRTDWLSGLFASHPPSQGRVNANIATAATLPAGGKTGEAEFQRAMQTTRAVKPAYDAYDEGRKALSEKKLDEALALSNKALDLFSQEAHFHALRGDVRLVADKYDMAVTNYSRAIERRNDFFYYHLQRGLAKKELGQTDGAVVDLERSIGLLPTAPAHYALGGIAQQRGNIPEAIKHFKAVAGAGGEYGKAATAALVRLELPSNPSAYVLRRCDPDANGNLVVSVKNDTAVQITGVQVVVEYADAYGRQQQVRHEVRGQIPPGQIASVNTGLGPYTAGASCPATVVAAQVAE
ncbi:MAG: M48 family metalloprotease [Gammaproteobacteria bacterium]|nr:M48 family metalloprotease [Gammaproteobacteria bacterium]MDH3363934.1 M48 family metalloprotease [Gammaproteobacteria bacterium]MDH3480112.1 M48 family metalloprotease [Gammaproteobacteria bacterium]